jgi:hypothetical protein
MQIPSSEDTLMQRRERPVFVLDVLDRATFAFEAESLAKAEEFTRAPWFAPSLSGFLANKRKEWDKNVPLQTRIATEEEASIYREVADEFSDVSGRLFIAHLRTDE